MLGELRALGVRLALVARAKPGDEAAGRGGGTGYSSLARIRHLEVDRLMVDRSFTAELDDAPAEQTIVAAIIGLARALGPAVTADGVETEEQLARVRSLGCDAVQGVLLARPAPPDEIAHLLHQPLGASGFELGLALPAPALTPPGDSARRASAPTSP